MKKTFVEKMRSAALAVFLAAFPSLSHAQIATWNGGGGNTDWNNALNWDVAAVPAEGTNANIGAVTVDYNAPMAATGFDSLNLGGTLNVNASGFNIDSGGVATVPINLSAGALLQVNSGGVVTITNSGRLVAAFGSFITVQGGTLIMSNNVAGSSGMNLGANGNNIGARFTNNAGTVIFDQRVESRGRSNVFVMNGGTLKLASGTNGIVESSNDQERPWLINGGVAELGDFVISRTLPGPGAGLVISNGTVTTSSLRVGTMASRAFAGVWGGTLTNTGLFTICDRNNGATGERRVQFLIRGGTVVSTTPEGIIVANQANNANNGISAIGGILDVNAGTLISEGITLVKDNTLTNAHGTLLLSGSGTIYLGPVGLVANVGPSNTSYVVTLSGGTLGAKDNYSINANMSLSGTTPTIQAANSSGTPFNITHNGVISGSGSLTKTGNGILTLNTNDTYSGNTIINGGTLTLGATGSISNSPQISVASGAVFNVSAVSGGFVLNATRTLSGSGSVAGNVTAAPTSIINPGSNAVTGTLTFSNAVTFPGNAIAHFDLSTNPSGPNNDLIVINGDLNASGTNTLEIVGGGAPGSVHKLFQYGGNFNGTVGNFAVSGATGSLSNNAVAKTISLVIAATVRNPTNVTWVGNSIVNDWDVLNRTNWLNNGTGLLDFFVTGDTVLFNATGAANPIVNIPGNVSPGSLTVNAAGNYTFSGNGAIAGSTGLTKTNTGTLTITTTNSYTGATTISGGTVDVSMLANGGANSGIGAANSGAANLVLDSGTLRYSGASVGIDRAATLNSGGGTFDVFSAATTLTLNGSLTGNGQLRKAGAGMLTLATANTHTNGSVVNGGRLALANATSAGTGGITNNGATLRVNGALVVDNIVEFNGTCNVEVSSLGGGNAALRGSWYGNGTVNITILDTNVAQTFTIGGQSASGGNMDNFFGTVDFGTNTGNLRLNNDNSTFNFGSSNAAFNLGTGTGSFNQRNGGTTNYLGALSGGPNTRLAGRGNTGASGTVTYSIGGKNLSTVFDGTITNGAGASPTAIIKVGTGKLTLTGTNVHTGDTIVSQGTLEIDGDNGTSTVTCDGGTIAGNGIIGGPVTITAGGSIAPGASGIGQLTINNSLQLDPSVSTTVMQLNKAANTNDSIIVQSTVSYGGTLTVVNLGGTLTENDTFVLFIASPGNYFNAFDVLNLPALSPGLSWDTSSLPVDGSIRVVAGLHFTSTIRSGSNLIMSGSNGVSSSTYFVLSTTNIAIPRSNWVVLSTNLFEADGSFNITNPIVPGVPRRFYLLQQAP